MTAADGLGAGITRSMELSHTRHAKTMYILPDTSSDLAIHSLFWH